MSNIESFPSAFDKEAPILYRSNETRRKRIPSEWVAEAPEHSDVKYWAVGNEYVPRAEPIEAQPLYVASPDYTQQIYVGKCKKAWSTLRL